MPIQLQFKYAESLVAQRHCLLQEHPESYLRAKHIDANPFTLVGYKWSSKQNNTTYKKI